MKKIWAFLLSLTLLLNPVSVFGADTDYGSDMIPAGYIPLRNAAEISGANVFTEGEYVIVEYKGVTYKYKQESFESYTGENEIKLSYPVIIRKGKTYAHYDDVAYLFTEENDSYKETKKTVVTLAYSLMDTYDVPGTVFTLTDGDTGYTWTRGFGYSDIENNIKAEKDTVFNLASISKVFTAISVMQLAELGKINLNEKVTHYIPELNIAPHPIYGGDFKDITVNMLLSHVSGIPGDLFDSFYTKDTYNKDYMNKFVENINKEYMDNKPLERWSYSNSSYVLLGIIASRAAGFDDDFNGFIEYTQKNIFEKTGMKNTSFFADENIKSKLAVPYSRASEPKEKSNLIVNALPAGGLYSTAEDMSEFMKIFLNNGPYGEKTLLTDTSISVMTSPSGYDMGLNPQLIMGKGMYITEFLGVKMVGHGGDVAHYHSDMQLSLDNKIGVFASANSSSSVLLSSALTAYALNSAVDEKIGAEPEQGLIKSTKPIKPGEEALKKYEGYFTNIGKISVFDDESLLINDYGLQLISQDDGSFYSGSLGRITFETVKGINLMLFGDGPKTVLGEGITPEKIDEDFSKWEGSYIPYNQQEYDCPVLKLFKVGRTEEGYGAVKFTTTDNQESSRMLLGNTLEKDMYYILGTARNHGKVLKFYEENGLQFLEVYGIKAVKVDTGL